MSLKTHKCVGRVFYKGREMLPNTPISADDVGGESELRILVSGGHVVAITAPVASARTAPPALPSDNTTDATAPDGATKAGQIAAAQAAAAAHTPVSKFAMDPDGIKGLSLQQLNVMVQERDDSIEPFETEAEAIACLSADFQGDSSQS